MARNKNFKCLSLCATVFRSGEGGATFAFNSIILFRLIVR